MTLETEHTNTAAKPHGFVTRAIHWISVLLIGYGYLKGLDSVDQLADPALWRSEVIFASGMGLFFAFRLFWTHMIGGATRLPREAPRWERLASRVVHLGLRVESRRFFRALDLTQDTHRPGNCELSRQVS